MGLATSLRARLVVGAVALAAPAGCVLWTDFAPLASGLAADAGDAAAIPQADAADAEGGPPAAVGDLEYVKTWDGVAVGSLATFGEDTVVAASAAEPVVIDGRKVPITRDDVVVMRLDPRGNVGWITTFGGDVPSAADRPSRVSVGPDAAYVAGFFDEPTLQIGTDVLSRRGGYRAGFVAKIDAATGTQSWGRAIAHENPAFDLWCPGVAATPQGAAVACTFSGALVHVGPSDFATGANGGGREIAIAFFGVAGLLKWVNILKGAGDDVASSLAVDPATGDLLFAANVGSKSLKDTLTPLDLAQTGATTGSVPFVARYDEATGKAIWSKVLPEGSLVNVVRGAPDGATVLVAGQISKPVDFGLGTVTPRGAGDAFVLALDAATRAPRWQKLIGGTNTVGAEIANDLAVDRWGEVVVVGFNRSLDTAVDGKPVPSPPQHVTDGWGSFMVKLSPSGQVLWTRGYSTQALGDAVGMASVDATPSGKLRVSGGLQGTAPLDGTNNVTAKFTVYQQVLWGFGP